eukprot:GHVQ01016002.1.p1 GENE.GHVQ01016002.1~~GHVQ01016002.1.p1  ORF type:complete len:781 (+),score=92.12 GHVQ01016002.1:128-2470(+)
MRNRRIIFGMIFILCLCLLVIWQGHYAGRQAVAKLISAPIKPASKLLATMVPDIAHSSSQVLNANRETIISINHGEVCFISLSFRVTRKKQTDSEKHIVRPPSHMSCLTTMRDSTKRQTSAVANKCFDRRETKSKRLCSFCEGSAMVLEAIHSGGGIGIGGRGLNKIKSDTDERNISEECDTENMVDEDSWTRRMGDVKYLRKSYPQIIKDVVAFHLPPPISSSSFLLSSNSTVVPYANTTLYTIQSGSEDAGVSPASVEVPSVDLPCYPIFGRGTLVQQYNTPMTRRYWMKHTTGDADIVFIHGIRGNSLTTWRQVAPPGTICPMRYKNELFVDPDKDRLNPPDPFQQAKDVLSGLKGSRDKHPLLLSEYDKLNIEASVQSEEQNQPEEEVMAEIEEQPLSDVTQERQSTFWMEMWSYLRLQQYAKPKKMKRPTLLRAQFVSDIAWDEQSTEWTYGKRTVHGRQLPVHWPEEYLPVDFPTSRIISVTYPAPMFLSRWKRPLPPPRLMSQLQRRMADEREAYGPRTVEKDEELSELEEDREQEEGEEDFSMNTSAEYETCLLTTYGNIVPRNQRSREVSRRLREDGGSTLHGKIIGGRRVLMFDKTRNQFNIPTYKWGVKRTSEFVWKKLRDVGVGKDGRPVVFITHSAGGIIAKNIITHDKDLQRATRGVVFYAVPHLGCPLSRIPDEFKVVFSKLVKDLNPRVTHLRDLHSNFINISKQRGIKILSYMESKPTNLPFNLKELVRHKKLCSQIYVYTNGIFLRLSRFNQATSDSGTPLC